MLIWTHEDQDGDGRPEILIGYPTDENSSGDSEAGRLFLLGTRNREVLWVSEGDRRLERRGLFLSLMGDYDGDGVGDILSSGSKVTVNGGDLTGQARILSGRTGETLRTLNGDTPYVQFSEGVLGDPNDPHRIWIGSPEWREPLNNYAVGRVQAFEFDPFQAASATELSVSSGGTVDFQLDFPDHLAGHVFKVLASAHGYGPTTINGLKVPLSDDAVLQYGLAHNGYPGFAPWGGTLDANAAAQFRWRLRQDSPPILIGRDFWISTICFDPLNPQTWKRASFPSRISLLP